jgi:tight adherence protein B
MGLGLVLILPRRRRESRRRVGPLTRLVTAAHQPRLTVTRVVMACLLVGVVAALVAVAVTGLPVVGLLAAVIAGASPIALLHRRARLRQHAVAVAWPEAIDALVSSVRAGMSLPDALADLARRGPAALQPAFAAFAADYHASGSFTGSCAALRDRLADPVADRVLAALAIARDVGGHDVGRVLRTLAALVREEARSRGEVSARQSWTVNAARVAAAAPWITLGLMALRPQTSVAYASPGGAVVLVGAAMASVVAYALMLRIASMPSLPRLEGRSG